LRSGLRCTFLCTLLRRLGAQQIEQTTKYSTEYEGHRRKTAKPNVDGSSDQTRPTSPSFDRTTAEDETLGYERKAATFALQSLHVETIAQRQACTRTLVGNPQHGYWSPSEWSRLSHLQTPPTERLPER